MEVGLVQTSDKRHLWLRVLGSISGSTSYEPQGLNLVVISHGSAVCYVSEVDRLMASRDGHILFPDTC